MKDKKPQCVSHVIYNKIQQGRVLHYIVIIVSSVCISCHQSIFQVYFRSHSYHFRLYTSFHITAGFIVKSNFMAGWWGSIVSEDECYVCTWLWRVGYALGRNTLPLVLSI